MRGPPLDPLYGPSVCACGAKAMCGHVRACGGARLIGAQRGSTGGPYVHRGSTGGPYVHRGGPQEGHDGCIEGVHRRDIRVHRGGPQEGHDGYIEGP